MIVTIVLWIAQLLVWNSAPEERTLNYIEKYAELAVIEMHRTGVPASITLSQAILESNSGTSKLATQSNNHFGIKCKSYWRGQTYYHKDDDRDRKGTLIKSCFRSYNRIEDSYIDHSNFLQYSSNYEDLFSLNKMDFTSWAYGLKKSGYATDPGYAEKLIKIIKKYKLYLFDSLDDPRVWISEKD